MCPFKIWVNAIFEEIFIFLAHYKLCRKCSGFRPCVQHWYTGTNHSQWGRARVRFHLPLDESSCTSVPFNSAHLDIGSLLYLTCFTSFFHFFSKNKINRKGKKKKSIVAHSLNVSKLSLCSFSFHTRGLLLPCYSPAVWMDIRVDKPWEHSSVCNQNACYFFLKKNLSHRYMSKRVKALVHYSQVVIFLVYDSED